MSRIIQAESGIEAKCARFADLDETGGECDSFLIPTAPDQESAQTEITEKGSEKDPGGKKKKDQTPQQPPVDIEAIRSEAYKNGKADGRKEVEEELHSASSALAEGAEQISRMRSSLLEKSRDDMVRLVMAVARRVIDTEVEEKKDIIVKTVTRALEGAVEDDEYYIRVNPEDIETVRANEPMFLAAMKGLRNIYFVADENVSRGGCMAESRAGDVDATIESQIDEIYCHLCGSQEQQ